jgi:uncharacterized protein (DUF2141 family)
MTARSWNLRNLAFLLSAFAAAPTWAAAQGKAGDITVTVSTVRNHNGQIVCALFDSAVDFDKRVATAKVAVPASTPAATCVFHNVRPGIYAVTAFHDENGNGRLDKSFFGRPKEGYGVSNNHTYAMHGPVFAESELSVTGSGNLAIAIHLRYP